MDREAIVGEVLPIAQAAHNHGGLVIAQVEKITDNPAPPHAVHVPGILIDALVVSEPRQHGQTFAEAFNPTYVESGDRVALGPMPFSERKIIARRVLSEIAPGSIVNLGIGRSQPAILLLVRTEEDHALGAAIDLPIADLQVGSGEEAVFIHLRVNTQRRDQPDIRTFGRLDRADSSIVRDMNIPHLETGAFTVETTGSQGAQAPLVSELGERVGLVDHLRQLTAAEEEVNRTGNRLGVDQAARRERILLHKAHAFLHGTLELEEALAELLAGQLTDSPDTAIAEMVNIVDKTFSIPQANDIGDRVDQVLLLEGHLGLGNLLVELPVDPEPTNPAQAVLLRVEELVVEELLRLRQLRRVPGAQTLVDPDQGILMVLGKVILQGIDDQQVLGLRNNLDRARLSTNLPLFLIVTHGVGNRLGDLFTGVDDDRPRGFLDNILCTERSDDFIKYLLALELDLLDVIEEVKNLGGGRVLFSHGAQQAGRRELSALIDSYLQGFLLADVELNPTAALRDDAAGMETHIAAVVFLGEIDAGGTVQLADDDTLSAIDDELSPTDHPGNLAQVDLFLDGFFLLEAKPDFKGHPIGQAKIPAFGLFVAGATELVADIFQRHAAVVTRNGENFPQDRFKANHLAVGVVLSGLEKVAIGPHLQFHEVRNGYCVPRSSEDQFR